MSREKFGFGIAFDCRQMAAGIEQADIVDVVAKPVGGYENGRHRHPSSQEGTGRFFSRRNAGFQTFD